MFFFTCSWTHIHFTFYSSNFCGSDGHVTRRSNKKMGERTHGRMDKWQDDSRKRWGNAYTDGWTSDKTIQWQEGGTHTRTDGQVTRQSNDKRAEHAHGWTDNWPGEPMQQINNPPKWRNKMAGWRRPFTTTRYTTFNNRGYKVWEAMTRPTRTFHKIGSIGITQQEARLGPPRRLILEACTRAE